MKTLKEVQKYLNSIDCINCGGCGIAAYSMYLQLKKNNLITDKFKFVLCYKSYCEDCYVNNQDVLRNHSGNAIAPTHMVIYYNNEYLDSTGVEDVSDYKWIQHVTEEWFIQNCINNVPTWNYMFDRSFYIPKIEQTLGINLNITRE